MITRFQRGNERWEGVIIPRVWRISIMDGGGSSHRVTADSNNEEPGPRRFAEPGLRWRVVCAGGEMI